MGLGGEAEVGCGAGNPVLESCGRGKAAEGGIQLHSVQLGRIEFQEFFLRQLLRKKRRLPTRVRPSRRADVERHGESIQAASGYWLLAKPLASGLFLSS